MSLKTTFAGFTMCAALSTGLSQAQTSELRGYWADSFHTGYKTNQEIDTMLARLLISNANCVFPQVRARGDAYYNSAFEPWSTGLSSQFDALNAIIQRAHNTNPRIEVHAWMNAHTIWGEQTYPTNPKHLLNRHPEWITQDNNGATFISGLGYGLDWGHPGGSDWTARVYMDVVRNYDVDGIHFDYIRYAGNTWGYNPISVQRFKTQFNTTATPAPTNVNWQQFRRDQVSALVRKIWVNTMALKPNVRVSAALIPWGNGPTSEQGWYSSQPYTSVMQDWRAWLEEGILDTGIPMCYFDEQQYYSYYRNWANFIKDHQYNRSAAIGLGVYLNSIAQTMAQVDKARDFSDYNATFPRHDNKPIGVNFYSYAGTNDNGAYGAGTIAWYNSQFYSQMGQYFGSAASVPSMPWKQSPTKGHLRGSLVLAEPFQWADGLTVTISGPSGLKTQKADGTGAFAFIDLPPGNYGALVSQNGQTVGFFSNLKIEAGKVQSLFEVIGEAANTQRVSFIRDLDALPDGTSVILASKIVQSKTGHFADRVYVADWQNGAGIGVKEPTQNDIPWQVGDVVAIKGVLTTESTGERVIASAQMRMSGFEWARKTRTLSLRAATLNKP